MHDKLVKKPTSSKTKHAEAKKKLTDLIKRVKQISEKCCDFSLSRMYFTHEDGYQIFFVYAPVHSFLILDSN